MLKTGGAQTRWRNSGTIALVLAAAIGGLALTLTSLRSASSLRATWPADADTLVLPSATVVRLFSLGHREMAADLIAARANVYFGAQLSARGDQRWLARALNTSVDLDPRFHRIYLRGAAMLVYGGRTINIDGLLAANDFLERGRREFPGDWELPFQQGFNLLFELPKLAGENDARVPEWRQRGIEALRQATLLDGGPIWLPNLAARMLTKEGGEELAIRHLERTYEVTNNQATRAEIARKLSELHNRRRAEELAAGAAALDRAISERYPYAPEAFSLILGPRLEPGVDLQGDQDAVTPRDPLQR